MAEWDSIEEVSQEIQNNLSSNTNKKSIALLYAFNATWKTRLSALFDSLNEVFWETLETEEVESAEIPDIKVFSYNAFIEDLFSWDNDEFILTFKQHWVFEFIEKQDLEWNIKNIYKEITNSKIEPKFNYDDESVAFPIITVQNDESILEENVKISKSEESIFIWSIYFAILEIAIESLNAEEGDRVTKKFNNLECIVIDDPVSSIDDTWIITIAEKLFRLIKSYKGNQINFLLTTHHALFYNVLFNAFKKLNNLKYEENWYPYILSKTYNNKIQLDIKSYDTPFSYHLTIIDIINKAIRGNQIERYHFNIFRSLLEKTATFLGRKGMWECVLWDKKNLYVRILNIYSHGKISELEYNKVQDNHKELFIECFTKFVSDFKYR